MTESVFLFVVSVLLFIGTLAILRRTFSSTRPGVDASIQRRGRDLHIVLHRVDRDPRADISVAIERDRSRWN